MFENYTKVATLGKAGHADTLKAGFHERQSRSRKRSRKSAYDLVKSGVVSGVISATESQSEESERFHFLPTPLMTPSFTI